MKAKRWLAAGLAAVLALSIAGCGSESGSSSNAAPTAQESTASAAADNKTASTQESSAAPAQTATAEAQPVGGTDLTLTAADYDSAVVDVVNVGIGNDPGELTPWGGPNGGKTATHIGLYEGLANIVNGEVHGIMLKDYSISDDQKDINVEIYDYIHDSEGNAITAEDVVFSLMKGKEIGMQSAFTKFESAEVTGDYTLVIHMGKEIQVGDLEEALVKPFIVSKAAYEASPDGMATTPVGTGPYKLKEYTSGYKLTYEAVEDYWQKDASLINPRDMQNAKEINFFIISEPSQRTMALEQGTIDICASVSSDDLAKFQEGGEQSEKYWVYNTPDNLSTVILPNCSEGKPTADLNLRLAIFYATNAQMVLASAYSGNGTLSHDFVPTWAAGYNTAWDSEDNFYNYDLEKAKDYLSKSTYAGEKLKILTANQNDLVDTATLLQQMLQAAGIDSEIVSVEASIQQSYREDPEQFDILVDQIATDAYAVKGWDMAFTAGRYAWEGTRNFAFDDELQEAIEKASVVGCAQADIDAVHKIVTDNAYGMLLVNVQTSYVVPKWMSNVTLTFKKAPVPGGCIYTEK